jgi:hypothetical protein
VRLYVARRGWHIDIGFAVTDLTPPLRALSGNFPDGVRYLMFGFGDARYLMAKTHHGPQLLEALWPGPGLLLVTALKASPAAAFGSAEVIELPLGAPSLQAAQAFVWRSLSERARTAGPIGPGPYEGSAFFDSSARYSALHTCNTWAAEVIRAAGWPVHHVGVVFAAQLWASLQRLTRAARRGGGQPYTPQASAAAAIAP